MNAARRTLRFLLESQGYRLEIVCKYLLEGEKRVDWHLQKSKRKRILQKVDLHEARTKFSKMKGASNIRHDTVINVEHFFQLFFAKLIFKLLYSNQSCFISVHFIEVLCVF